MMKLIATLSAIYAVSAVTLKEQILNSLEQKNEVDTSLDLDAEGAYNCANKCQFLFGKLDYQTAQDQQASTGNNEYRGCMIGCDKCSAQRADTKAKSTDCFVYCKNYNYLAPSDGITSCGAPTCPIVKGVIEPDKACIYGCVLNLCQDICTGDAQWGTTPQNNNGITGCQIQTNQGVTTYQQGPSGGFNEVCCNYMGYLCNYSPPEKQVMSNPNYKTIYDTTRKNACKGESGINPKSSVSFICNVFETALANNQCVQTPGSAPPTGP